MLLESGWRPCVRYSAPQTSSSRIYPADFHKDVTEGCALQGLSRGASAVIKGYAVVPKETESAACAEEPPVCDEVLPTAGGHVLSPILTCRSIPDLTGWGLPPASVCLSIIHLSSISVSVHATMVCVWSSEHNCTGLVLLSTFRCTLESKLSSSDLLWCWVASTILACYGNLGYLPGFFPAVLKLMALDISVLCKGVWRTLDEVVPTHLDPELASKWCHSGLC